MIIQVMNGDGTVNIPASFDEATNSNNKKDWSEAIADEVSSLNEKHTWELVRLPARRTSIPVRWTYDLKVDCQDNVTGFKARLVRKVFMQIERVDFSTVFSPVSKINTVRLVLELMASKGWTPMFLDIEAAFLNPLLDQELYVSQPEGFKMAGKVDHVYRILKA